MNLKINKDVIISKQTSLGDFDVEEILSNCKVVHDTDGQTYFIDRKTNVVMYSAWIRDSYYKEIIRAFERGDS